MDFGCEMGYTKIGKLQWLFSGGAVRGSHAPPNHLHVDLWIDFEEGWKSFCIKWDHTLECFFVVDIFGGANWWGGKSLLQNLNSCDTSCTIYFRCRRCCSTIPPLLWSPMFIFSKNTWSCFFCLEKKSFLTFRDIRDMRFTASRILGGNFFCRFFFHLHPGRLTWNLRDFSPLEKVTSSEAKHHGFRCDSSVNLRCVCIIYFARSQVETVKQFKDLFITYSKFKPLEVHLQQSPWMDQ